MFGARYIRATERFVVRLLPRVLRERFWSNPLFDARWYLVQYPDVAGSGISPKKHFRTVGWREGRDPNEFFDTDWYLKRYPEVALAGADPLDDYFLDGYRRGRDPSPRFETDSYLTFNPDIRAAGVNPLQHYLRWGRRELRSPVRRDPSIGVWVPPSFGTSDRKRMQADPGAPIAVVVHLYYTDLWDEITTFIDNLDRARLFISLVHETAGGIEERIKADYPDADIRYFENVGRDVGPFMEFLASGAFDGCESVCKIHTKRSLQLVDGDEWRRALMQALLGSGEICRWNVEAFQANPTVGLIAPTIAFLPTERYIWPDRGRIMRMARAMGKTRLDADDRFVAGTMFWFRPSAIEPLRKLGIRLDQFDAERGQMGRTMHHALEIGIPLSVRAAGFDIEATEKFVQTGTPAT